MTDYKCVGDCFTAKRQNAELPVAESVDILRRTTLTRSNGELMKNIRRCLIVI